MPTIRPGAVKSDAPAIAAALLAIAGEMALTIELPTVQSRRSSPRRRQKSSRVASSPPRRVAMAVVAHPDDIEFLMAGTLLLLGQAGYDLHYLTLANGSCGTLTRSRPAIRRIRRRESRAAAAILGARYHASLTEDLEILYELKTLRRLAAIVREVRPAVMLIPSPQDYMEDHTNTCRLAVTAGFVRGMPNFRTIPGRPPTDQEVTLYHAMPHGLRDPLRQPVVPEAFVDTGSTHATKRRALAAHASQQELLGAFQGMESYLEAMEQMSRVVGAMSGRFTHAEGWRRHSHLGFCASDADPLRDALGDKYLSTHAGSARLQVEGEKAGQ